MEFMSFKATRLAIVTLLLSLFICLSNAQNNNELAEGSLKDIRVLNGVPTITSLRTRTRTIRPSASGIRTQTKLRTPTFRRTNTRTSLGTFAKTLLRTQTRASPSRKTTKTYTAKPRSPSAKPLTRTAKRPSTPTSRPASLGCMGSGEGGVLHVGGNELRIVGSSLRNRTICNATALVATYSFVAPNTAVYAFSNQQYYPLYPDNWFWNGGEYDVSDSIVIQDLMTCSILAQGCSARSIGVSLVRNQRIILALKTGEIGADPKYLISITEYPPPGCAPAPSLGTTELVLGTNTLSPSCSPPYDVNFKMCQVSVLRPISQYFTAPTNGSYIFEILTAMPSALSVRNGCSVLGCSAVQSVKARPIVVTHLNAGQRVTVLAGVLTEHLFCLESFSLNIAKAVRECRVDSDCPPKVNGIPALGYKCITGGCYPTECRSDNDCPNECMGNAQVCDNYKCIAEFSYWDAVSTQLREAYAHCRNCMNDFGICRAQAYCCPFEWCPCGGV